MYHNNLTDTDKENIVLSVGFSNVKANSVEALNFTASGAMKADSVTAEAAIKGKSGEFASLTVNGKAYQPFEKTIIGYVVYAKGTSTARAGCFVPYGVSGRFQCASDDWYYQFTFDGYGNVSDGRGTGSYDSMETIYNG